MPGWHRLRSPACLPAAASSAPAAHPGYNLRWLPRQKVASDVALFPEVLIEELRNFGECFLRLRLKLAGVREGAALHTHLPAVGENSPYGMIGDRGNVGIIRTPVRASTLPDCHYRPSTGQCAHIGPTEYSPGTQVRLRMSQLVLP